MLVPGPVTDLAREIPYEQLNGVLNESNSFGRRVYMACGSCVLRVRTDH
jgi:hypothetical protein